MTVERITAERLREVLQYVPETGAFSWRASGAGRPASGMAGTMDHHGYWIITVDGRAYTAGKLAWFYATSSWPKADIDHINRNRSDNRLCNLREATRTQNLYNMRVRSKTGFKGVTWLNTPTATDATAAPFSAAANSLILSL